MNVGVLCFVVVLLRFLCLRWISRLTCLLFSARFLLVLQHWESITTDEGDTYYWHTLSGATQWEKPEMEYSQSSGGPDALRSFELTEVPKDPYTGPESRV